VASQKSSRTPLSLSHSLFLLFSLSHLSGCLKTQPNNSKDSFELGYWHFSFSKPLSICVSVSVLVSVSVSIPRPSSFILCLFVCLFVTAQVKVFELFRTSQLSCTSPVAYHTRRDLFLFLLLCLFVLLLLLLHAMATT